MRHDWEWALKQVEAVLLSLTDLEHEDPERWKRGKNFFVAIRVAMEELLVKLNEQWSISRSELQWLEKSLKALRKWDPDRF